MTTITFLCPCCNKQITLSFADKEAIMDLDFDAECDDKGECQHE